MLRCTLLAAAILLAAFAGNASAGSKQLSAAEIEALLGGNTVSGTWAGSDYKQYFGTDGFTMYVPAGGTNDEGKWRVNAAENSYESWWSATGWTSYKVGREGEGYVWIDSKGDAYPFVVLEGKQVSW